MGIMFKSIIILVLIDYKAINIFQGCCKITALLFRLYARTNLIGVCFGASDEVPSIYKISFML